jgi:hypothetical protein
MTRSTRRFSVTIAPPTPAIRYNPGHYVSLQRAQDSQTLMGQCVASAPQIKGFVKRWTWLSFESALQNYTFATHELNADLDWCQARGLKLCVMIEHITFGYQDNIPNPPYLNNWTGQYPTPGNPSPEGNVIAIWDSTVVNHLKRFLTAFHAYFGSHPALEAVMMEETSLQLPVADLTTPPTGKLWDPYTPELYRDALIEIMAHWATIAPTIRWWFYMNFMPQNQSGSYLNQAVLASPNCVISGPDTEPNHAALETRTYYIYRDNNDVRPVACFVSTQVYQSGATGDEIYALATDLGANYICWVCQGVSLNQWTNVARPQIIAHPTFNVEDWT